MIWALENNKKILATPKQKAECPICNSEVIAKCGRIKVWHWSHKSNLDCDDWYEPESEWHKNWKDEFPKECQEFTMGKHRADIRTKGRWIIELQNSSISSEEIQEREQYYKKMVWLLNGEKLAKGLRLRNKKEIITFRWKSPPKSWWMANKETYIDLKGIVEILRKLVYKYKEGLKIHKTPIYEQIYYKYYSPEAELIEVSYPKIVGYDDTTNLEIKKIEEKIDLFKDKIFLVKKIHHNIPCGGWGELITKQEFLRRFK